MKPDCLLWAAKSVTTTSRPTDLGKSRQGPDRVRYSSLMTRKKMTIPGLEDDLLFFSHHASALCNPINVVVPEGGKPKRRRRKGRGDAPGAEPKKRKLTAEQVNFLEVNFGNEHKLESARKDRLAAQLGLDPRTVAVWFQNRRARWRSKHLEEEYSRLKATHEGVVLEKCHLEAEVINLREQLSKAEEEIKKLSGERERSCSPSCSSFSVDADRYPDLFGDFRAEQNQSLLYMLENNYISVFRFESPFPSSASADRVAPLYHQFVVWCAILLAVVLS
ncbi:hypothetical protein H6P81_021092 [Aristolochia fimbriata]|uniref:Homeobox-leucine zipper protein n=1 Tax=Aristolochia fimbriata TaxID=158543 RepID=A0AAV7DZA1_ARIFI|nr:hypothetical protein H6P81_021092 [Aristolochia fimbriata]